MAYQMPCGADGLAVSRRLGARAPIGGIGNFSKRAAKHSKSFMPRALDKGSQPFVDPRANTLRHLDARGLVPLDQPIHDRGIPFDTVPVLDPDMVQGERFAPVSKSGQYNPHPKTALDQLGVPLSTQAAWIAPDTGYTNSDVFIQRPWCENPNAVLPQQTGWSPDTYFRTADYDEALAEYHNLKVEEAHATQHTQAPEDVLRAAFATDPEEMVNFPTFDAADPYRHYGPTETVMDAVYNPNLEFMMAEDMYHRESLALRQMQNRDEGADREALYHALYEENTGRRDKYMRVIYSTSGTPLRNRTRR